MSFRLVTFLFPLWWKAFFSSSFVSFPVHFHFSCAGPQRSPFEVGKHVLRGEIISKFTLAMDEAIFFAVYIKDVTENGKR